jgi:vancomycin resistance protein YoaR
MKKNNFFLILFLLLLPFYAQAADDFIQIPQRSLVSGFILTHKNEKITVDGRTLETWEGFTALPQQTEFFSSSASLSDSLKLFFGEKPVTRIRYAYYSNSPTKIYSFLQNLAPQVDNPVVEPYLKIQNNRAVEFTPPQNGKKLDVHASALNLLTALEANQKQAALTVNLQKPGADLRLTNNLGINELLGHGESTFTGSSKNRRHNIKVGMEKVRGTIIAPGSTFSFNDALGSVEAKDGFVKEIVIKATGLVPELGGGLCQVSSTTFRAAMDAGVPITQRKNHSFAVSHYAPQGTDATIYPGAVDLKFTNDTPSNLLVWAYLKNENTLVFDFYGTKDSRQVVIEKPIQYDKKPDGSMKATWTRKVMKNGQTREDVFKSVYLPPAMFKKVEQFVPAPTGPVAPVAPPPATQ